MKRIIWGFLKHPVDPVAIHWIKGHPGFTSRSKCFTKQVPSPHVGYPNGPKLSYVREYYNSQIYEICDSPHESEYKNVHLGTLTLLKSHHLHKSNAFGKLSITWADDREKNSCCQPLYNHYIIGTSYSVISCAHILINKHAGIYALWTRMNKVWLTSAKSLIWNKTLFDVILLYSKGRNIMFLPRKITSRLLLSHAANNPHTISQPSLVTAPPARLLKSDCASSATAMEGGTPLDTPNNH